MRTGIAILAGVLLAGVTGGQPDALPEGAKVRLGSTRFRNGTRIQTVALSPDGKQIACCGSDKGIRLWDARTGVVVPRCDASLGPVHQLSYAPDGKSLAALSFYRGVRVHDTTTGRLRWSMTQNGGDNCVAWSLDGKTIASGGRDGTIRLIDTSDGNLRERLSRRPGMISALHFTPDGKHLYSLGSDNQLFLWNVAAGRGVRQRVVEESYSAYAPESFAFTPDGKALVTGLSNRGMRLWDTTEGAPPRQLAVTERPRTARYVAFSADGRHLITSGNGMVSLWDFASGKELRSFPVPGNPPVVAPVAISHDARTLVAAVGSFLEVWDVREWQRLPRDSFPDAAVSQLAFLNAGKTLVSLHESGGLYAWDVEKGRLLATHADRFVAEVGLGALPGGKAVRAYNHTSASWLDWEPGGKSEARPWRGALLLPLSPDGRTYVQPEKTGAVLHDGGTDRALRKLLEPPQDTPLYHAEDGQRFAGRDGNGRLRVWDVERGRGSNPLPGPDGRRSCYLSPGGRTIIQLIGGVRVWEVLSGGERSSFPLSKSATTAAFSPDGQTLVVGTVGGEVLAIDLDTGKEIVRRAGHTSAVRCLRFSPDGRLLGSGGDDTTIVIWDAAVFRVSRHEEEKLGREQALRLWDSLRTEDAAKAFQLIRALSSGGAEVVPLIREKLRPMREESARKIRRLVEQLEDRRFARREAAVRDLLEIGPEAAPALEQLLSKEPSLDAKQRAEQLLRRYRTMPAGSRLQGMRAVEVLERMATPAARAALTELAGGGPDAWLTREAKAALQRLR